MRKLTLEREIMYANNVGKPSNIPIHFISMKEFRLERPYLCEQCPKTFACHASLQSHERTQDANKSYICKQCGKEFSYSNFFLYQLTTHGEKKPYVCEYIIKPSKLNIAFTNSKIHCQQALYIYEHCGKA